jgi:HEAT repeat protein
MRAAILPCIASLTLAFTPAQSQSLTERVNAARDGAVTFHYTPRAGVCGDGERYMRIGRSYHGSFSTNMDRERCEAGPVQVQLSLNDGEVTRVQAWAGRLRRRDARDLGAVPAPEAARYLMSIAAHGSSSASSKAILPAVLADSATVWPGLLAIAKDTDSRSRQTRQDATFWLSRFAAGAIVGKPNEPFDDDDDDSMDGKTDLKAHAVFVLSQLPRHEGIPELLEIARSKGDPIVRSKALFWLGQSGDPRVLPLFESLLR